MKHKGYIYIKKPHHPFAWNNGYVPEHRLVVETNIGRYLLQGEVVHHINGIKDDNRLQNLMVLKNNNLHMQIEKGINIVPSGIVFN